MIDRSHTAHEPHPTAAMDRQYRRTEMTHIDKLDKLEAEMSILMDRMRFAENFMLRIERLIHNAIKEGEKRNEKTQNGNKI